MNSKNDFIRDYIGVSAWHKAGYTGKRVVVLTGEKFEGADATYHGECTKAALLEIAPDATVEYSPFPGALNTTKKFLETIEKTGASAMFYSMSVSAMSGKKNIDENIPDRVFVAVAAGNYGDDYANAYMRPDTVYGVGAVDFVWSVMVNGQPAPGAELIIKPAGYTSISEVVDFGAPTGLYLDGNGRFNGTSCACPALVGMVALVNDFFIDKTGAPLTHEKMYQFLKDCSEDIRPEGKDDKVGWGMPILPAPGKINIEKYQPDYKEPEEDEEMSYNDFLKYMKQYEAQRAAKPEPAWSKQEGHFAKAKKEGIMDGTRPEDPVKRDELAAILGRMGLIGGDAK